MEFDKVLNSRRSVRDYLKKPVPRELLTKLIEAAFVAPTSCNLQLTRYVIIDDPKIIEKLGREASYKFVSAPACVLVIYDPRFTVERSSVVSSAAMGAENILLKAVDLGLATCPMAGFSKDDVIKNTLNIPKELEILLLITVGFPFPDLKTVPPFKISQREVYNFNGYNFEKGLNESDKLSNHSIADIIKYRSRISTVYLDRFRLNTFSEDFYKKAFQFWDEFIKSKNIKNLIDVLSYDGIFLKYLYSGPDTKNLKITASDYLETNLDFFRKIFNCGTCLINDRNEFMESIEYEAATFVFQADFTPRLEDLIRQLNKTLRPKGYVFVALVEDGFFRQLLKNIISYWRIIRGKRVNIYEGNSFYKIGPRRHLSPKLLIKIFKDYNFCITKLASQKMGKDTSLNFFVFQKET